MLQESQKQLGQYWANVATLKDKIGPACHRDTAELTRALHLAVRWYNYSWISDQLCLPLRQC